MTRSALAAATLCAVAVAVAAVAATETSYQRWLHQDVVYIIEPAEKKAFESLKTDEERNHFIGQFWDRRPGRKEEHYRRIAYTNERFASSSKAGWETDRGHIYILHGPPDEIESHPADGREVWLYHKLPGIGDRVFVEFRDANHTGDYRQTRAPKS